jgi:hypothetical protein
VQFLHWREQENWNGYSYLILKIEDLFIDFDFKIFQADLYFKDEILLRTNQEQSTRQIHLDLFFLLKNNIYLIFSIHL